MPDVFVPPEIAASFVAYMRAQGSTLPTSFTELSSRLTAALDNPSPLRQPLPSQQTQLPSTSPGVAGAARAAVPLPRRAGVLRRTCSAPPEDTAGREDFIAAPPLQTLPALPILRRAAPTDARMPPTPSPIPVLSSNRYGSPTIQGDGTPPSFGRNLSPLRLPSETPGASPSFGKRKALVLDEGEGSDSDDEDEADWRRREEAAQRHHKSWTGLKNESTKGCYSYTLLGVWVTARDKARAKSNQICLHFVYLRAREVILSHSKPSRSKRSVFKKFGEPPEQGSAPEAARVAPSPSPALSLASGAFWL
ncbi:hypothetical protein GGX14DRAFT_390975 [Mycena pura]|uniref:Uncharacterized protein n=1 Tax=Mycena pura TaxID=153505 RepID=A0AAD6YEL8_9AGAR|nr:hypothetical protein GGX14DRAFT_390975 [Mycena pura]